MFATATEKVRLYGGFQEDAAGRIIPASQQAKENDRIKVEDPFVLEE